MRLRQHAVLSLLLFLCTAVFADEKSTKSAVSHTLPSTTLKVTTTSPQARKLFEAGMVNLEYLRTAQALEDLRAATKKDPKFAQALILLSNLTTEPEEELAARTRAKQLAGQVSAGERLLIRWLSGVQEDNYVPAIAAMNDLLAQYPRDQRLAFLAGRWLVQRQRYAQAVLVLERAVTLAPDYPANLNELAYACAFSGNFDQAFRRMDRYIALQPEQPNPHDSYGELLRMAGRFDAALEHYRTAVRLDPGFGSELGVADTFAVMGKEAEARDEYARGMLFVKSQSEKVEYELQAAVTWIREGNRRQAEHAFREVARHAHGAGLARLEAEAHRNLAMYELDYKTSLKHLKAAENALEERHVISQTDRNEERARILRVLAARAADAGAFDTASQTIERLEKMAQASRSQVIQLSYHAAAGAVLMAQEKYAEAIPHLEEDSGSPLSMQLLWRAYGNTGARAEAAALQARLAAWNVPTVEQALVVPPFRAGLVSQNRP